MTDPLVCAILLTRDRPRIAARAVASFRTQTYANKRLFVLDNGDGDLLRSTLPFQSGETWLNWNPARGKSIGVLRNMAAELSCTGLGMPQLEDDLPEIVVHWDSDDVSHPNRIAEQVALLQSSGADCVGYRDMLFWRTFPGPQAIPCPAEPHPIFVRRSGSILAHRDSQGHTCVASEKEWGEAWLFTGGTPNYALGTSLCYWRQTWARKSFLDQAQGVEEKWCDGLKVVSVASMIDPCVGGAAATEISEPRMIASIHGGNTSTGYDIEKYVRDGSKQWQRAPEWDNYCRERMKL